MKIHDTPHQNMDSALHIGMGRYHGAPGTASGKVSGHGFWTEISGVEAPFEMSIAVPLHAPDCKTPSSIGN